MHFSIAKDRITSVNRFFVLPSSPYTDGALQMQEPGCGPEAGHWYDALECIIYLRLCFLFHLFSVLLFIRFVFVE